MRKLNIGLYVLLLVSVGFLVAGISIPTYEAVGDVAKVSYQSPAPQDTDGWSKYQLYILAQLKDMNERLCKIDSKLEAMDVRIHNNTLDVSVLNVKAGMWGGVMGLGASVGTLLGSFLLNKRKKNGGDS